MKIFAPIKWKSSLGTGVSSGLCEMLLQVDSCKKKKKIKKNKPKKNHKTKKNPKRFALSVLSW